MGKREAPCLSCASETKGLKQKNCKIAGRELKVTALAFILLNEENMWKVYKWNGHYIMGDLISKHSSEAAALKAAKKKINFTRTEKQKKGNETLIWLDSKSSQPLGVIIKKSRG